MRLPKVHTEVNQRSEVTPYGGLTLFSDFVRRFKVAQKLDAKVQVLKLHLPYFESDHVLAQAANLYVGGTCIEDMANLQNSEAALRLLGACRIPDPTTGGDFLRRFDDRVNQGSLAALRAAVDEVQGSVWKELEPRRGRRRCKRDVAVIDLDGHTKVLYGAKKEGADFSHKGQWSYHPLLVSLAGTGECLAIRNRSGNLRSSHGAAEVLNNDVLSRVGEHYEEKWVRGDSDFDRHDVRVACEAHDAVFFFVGRKFQNRPGIAASIPESQWRPFRTRAHRHRAERKKRADYRPRRKKRNRRRIQARQRNYKEKRLVRQWVAEVPYTQPGCDKTYRLVIRRRLIEHHKGQQHLFDEYEHRYISTNAPSSWTARDVVDATYERCDQENVIEQMGSGLAAWRMPVGEFAGNCAWLEIARLAWNIGKWIAQLALPPEVVRWEWKRFRQAFVYHAAQVFKRGRQLWIRLSGSHRFTASLVAAHQQLQT
jgi:hypothetical protein